MRGKKHKGEREVDMNGTATSTVVDFGRMSSRGYRGATSNFSLIRETAQRFEFTA